LVATDLTELEDSAHQIERLREIQAELRASRRAALSMVEDVVVRAASTMHAYRDLPLLRQYRLDRYANIQRARGSVARCHHSRYSRDCANFGDCYGSNVPSHSRIDYFSMFSLDLF